MVVVNMGFHLPFAVMTFLFFVARTSESGSSSSTTDQLYWSQKALDYLDNIQNNCSSRKYAIVDIGIGGGFAAQFQLAGGEFMSALAGINFQAPVFVRGKLSGYSEAPECADQNYKFTCYFQPTSICEEQEDFMKNSELIKPSSYIGFDDSVPAPFRHLGTVFWWDIIQYYLFRFKPFVYAHIHHEAKKVMHAFRGFPVGLPMAGIHVRHGDKRSDGFFAHSFAEELAHVRKSSDCVLQNSQQDCFVPVTFNISLAAMVQSSSVQSKDQQAQQYTQNLLLSLLTPNNNNSFSLSKHRHNNHHHSSYYYNTHQHGRHYRPLPLHPHKAHTWNVDMVTVLHEAMLGHITIIRREDFDRWNHSQENSALAVDPHMLLKAYMTRFPQLFANNETLTAHPIKSEIVHDANHKPKSSSHSEHGVSTSLKSVRASDSHRQDRRQLSSLTKILDEEYVIPLPIFVASDDPDVLHAAANLGFLTDSEGVSQHSSASKGMLLTLLSEKKLAFNATVEIITDIYFLSQCTTLVGIAASQIFRMAVALSNVTDRLHYVRIMDGNQLQRIVQMSRKYYIPFPEVFET